MITQTLALFLDAYRDLNSRKLFWVTLVLSGLFIGGFAILGVDPGGLKLFTHHIDMEDAPFWYRFIFDKAIIGLWLTWAAIILAIISTAGVFPDFITGGSIDLYLARPISRVRLFVTKYLSGLGFVALQVIVVAVGGFFVLGLRGHDWRPGLFWAVPIVVCFFSYLFAICVLFGVSTRSTIAALLLTILCWFVVAALDWSEPQILTGQYIYGWQTKQYADRADQAEANLRSAQKAPHAATLVSEFRQQSETARQQSRQSEQTARYFRNVHRIIYWIKLATPKTTDTSDLLERDLFTGEEAEKANSDAGRRRSSADPGDMNAAALAGGRETAQELRSRSAASIIGTSLAFEAIVVFWAGWIFCRRDY